MYLVIFLIIIILILIFKIYSIEQFKICNFFLENLDENTLKSYGNDVNKCIMDCYSNPLYKDNCGRGETCQKICIECKGSDSLGLEWSEEKKQKTCPWYNVIRESGSKEPDAAIIRGYPGDSSILIEWQRPNDNRSTITNYIIDVTESMSKKKSSQLIIVKDNDCKVCEFKIKGLKNQINHKVNIRAVNSKGIGPVSNTLEISPNGVDTELLKNIEDDLNTNVESDLKFNEYECMNGYKFNDLSLDLIDFKDINIVKQVHDLKPATI